MLAAAAVGRIRKFARWGYNYAYHFGDLSAAALPGHIAAKAMPKYRKWAQALFESAPTSSPRSAKAEQALIETVRGAGYRLRDDPKVA